MSSPVSTPRWASPLVSITACVRQKRSTASATKPCDQARAGHHGAAEALVMGDRGFRGRGPLTTDYLGLAGAHGIDDDRHVAARSVQVRLDHLQRESGCNRGIEGITALFQRRHTDGG